MDFRAAAAAVGATSAEIAAELGVAEVTVKKARGERADRRPPPGWELALAALARRRSHHLDDVANQLERQARAKR